MISYISVDNPRCTATFAISALQLWIYKCIQLLQRWVNIPPTKSSQNTHKHKNPKTPRVQSRVHFLNDGPAFKYTVRHDGTIKLLSKCSGLQYNRKLHCCIICKGYMRRAFKPTIFTTIYRLWFSAQYDVYARAQPSFKIGQKLRELVMSED